MTSDRCEVHAVDQEKVDRTRERLLDDQVYANLAETFGALADSNRAKIVYSLVGQELCVCDIACVVGISESAVSQHLRVLRHTGLVRGERRGFFVHYVLDEEMLDKHKARVLKTLVEDFSKEFKVEQRFLPTDETELVLHKDEREELKVSANTLTAMLSAFRAVLYQKEAAPFTEGDMKLREKVLELYPRKRSTPFPIPLISIEPKFERP